MTADVESKNNYLSLVNQVYPPPLILADGNIVINPETINIYTLDTDQQIKGVYIFRSFDPALFILIYQFRARDLNTSA